VSSLYQGSAQSMNDPRNSTIGPGGRKIGADLKDVQRLMSND
jgi:hypothetical protein